MASESFRETLESFLQKYDSTENATGLSQKWTDCVHRSYSEPRRFYHTVAHIQSMWKLCDDLRAQTELSLEDEEVVRLAIIFHDIVYDPRAQDNEEQSILVFQEFVKKAVTTVPEKIADEVIILIRATIKHRVPDSESYLASLAFFLDLDLEVLSRPREAYTSYADQIRNEYAHYPDVEFRAGRIAVLNKLGQGEIYFTELCKGLWTEKAKENLRWEIERLQVA